MRNILFFLQEFWHKKQYFFIIYVEFKVCSPIPRSVQVFKQSLQSFGVPEHTPPKSGEKQDPMTGPEIKSEGEDGFTLTLQPP